MSLCLEDMRVSLVVIAVFFSPFVSTLHLITSFIQKTQLWEKAFRLIKFRIVWQGVTASKKPDINKELFSSPFKIVTLLAMVLYVKLLCVNDHTFAQRPRQI